MHHLIGPLNIIDQSYCTTHSFTSTCFTVKDWQKARGMKLFEAVKEGKRANDSPLWAPTQVAVCLILPLLIIMTQIQEKKEEIWLGPMTTWRHKNVTKNFDYTTISERLRMVSWSKDSYPTGVVKPVYGIPTFPPKRIKDQTQFFCGSVYHDLPVSALVLISVAKFKIYS